MEARVGIIMGSESDLPVMVPTLASIYASETTRKSVFILRAIPKAHSTSLSTTVTLSLIHISEPTRTLYFA